MTHLELALIQQIAALTPEQQEQVLRYVEQIKPDKAFDYEAWFDQVEALHAELNAEFGDNHFFDSVEVLNEIREERLNDITGRR